jgi:ubiquitin-conjugating enzyme E2 J2
MICVRRVKKEYASIIATPVPNIKVSLDGEISSEKTNHLDWFCMIYDLEDERFANGEYIFNIRLSARYPFEPPDFYFITPNGRFALNSKLCFTNSSYHKECWSPRLVLQLSICCSCFHNHLYRSDYKALA